MSSQNKNNYKETEIGMMPEEWEIVSLSELTIKITKGTTPTTLGSRFLEKGINFVKVESLNGDGTINKNKFAYIDEKTNELLSRSKLELNDILYSIAGTIGRVSIVTKDILPANTNQALAIIRPNVNKIHLPYLRYALINPALKQYFLSKVVQAVQANLSLTEISNSPITIPSKKEQENIAKVLSDLDSKIALNQQMNKTLESIGQALFNQWFVNFEFPNEQGKPYKSFGGEMIDSELGEIPKGWKVERLKSVLGVIESGRRPKGGIDQTLRSGVPSIGAENINGLGYYDYSSTKYITEDFFNSMNQGVVSDKDVLLYKDGAKLGRKTMFGNDFPFNKCCINEHVFILRTNSSLNQHYLYFWLDQNWMTESIINLNANSAQPGINKESVGSLFIIVPNNDAIMKNFVKTTEHLFNKLFLNCLESKALSELRDSLLPKLMSGQIRVK